MEKYYVFMEHPVTKIQVFTQSWNLKALDEWIKHHEAKGYKLTKRG